MRKKNPFKLLKKGKITEEEAINMVWNSFIKNIEKEGKKNERY